MDSSREVPKLVAEFSISVRSGSTIIFGEFECVWRIISHVWRVLRRGETKTSEKE